ncbi:MAG: hypothetical protein PHY08_14365 [Candidatus Cloacimonetes bacterium]|nr:hypothetical protein [Candidatus Cloacimonadota bacterium]
MKIKYQQLKYLIALILSGMLLSFGIISLLIDQEGYKILSNLGIVFGSLGMIFGLLMLFYGYVYIYEANFDIKGINTKKRKKQLFIDFYDIKDMEYEKPSLFNYITSYGSKLYTGTLKVNLKKHNGKIKSYFIRLKYKDFERLPRKYKDLMKHPI